MKKRNFLIVIMICLLCSPFVCAQEGGLLDVIKYDFKLFWNGNELNIESPVLLINGQTYVPLRDIAEETGMDVNWNGNTREIRMTESNFWFEDIFSDTLGFEIPETADIVNYAYERYGRDISLHAKIFFKEDDLECIEEVLNKIITPLNDKESEDVANTMLMNISKEFDWWDLTEVKEAKYAYYGFMEGYEISTINVLGLICEASDSDGYYLYISH